MNDTELQARVRETLERTFIMALSTSTRTAGHGPARSGTSGIADCTGLRTLERLIGPRDLIWEGREPVSGIEPLTCRLQDGCSAN
jgi:hypothetical protein